MARLKSRSTASNLGIIAHELVSFPNESLAAAPLASYFRAFLEAVEQTSHILITDPSDTIGSKPIEARLLDVLHKGITGFCNKAQDERGLSILAQALVEFATLTFTHGFLKNAALELVSSISDVKDFLGAVEQTSDKLIKHSCVIDSKPLIEARLLDVLRKGFTGFCNKVQDQRDRSQLAQALIDFAKLTSQHGFLQNATLGLASSLFNNTTAPGYLPGFATQRKTSTSTAASFSPTQEEVDNEERRSVCPS